MERKVRTAVIGYGMISNIYLKNLKNLFYIIDLVAVGGRNVQAARAQADAFGVERAMTIDEVAASDDIELAVYPNIHFSPESPNFFFHIFSGK